MVVKIFAALLLIFSFRHVKTSGYLFMFINLQNRNETWGQHFKRVNLAGPKSFILRVAGAT